MSMTGANANRPVLGIDLGGTKILAAVLDADHAILGRSKRTTPARDGGDAMVAAILDAAAEAMNAAGVATDDLLGAVLGSPGPLDTQAGVLVYSANLTTRDFPIVDRLTEALGRPVLLRNDVRLGAYGEFRLGAGRGQRDMLVAFVGTGLGGALILDGKVVEGWTNNAGEIGHTVIKANGPACGCGRRGCLEVFASRTAITRRIHKAIRKGQLTPLAEHVTSKHSRLRSGVLAAAVAEGDLVAIKEVRRAAHYLGLGLGGLINVVGTPHVVIGGGVAEALGEPYLALVRESARFQMLFDPGQQTRFVPAALGDDAGILGASLIGREALG